MKTINTRTIAAKIITEMLADKKNLSKLLSQQPTNIIEARDWAFVQQLCYGVARWYYQLKFIADKLLQKKPTEKDRDIFVLILIGLYQLLHLQIKPHAALNETVNAARELKKDWAVGLINGVLRNFLRRQEELLKLANHDEEAKYSHPQWLINEIKANWSAQYHDIIQQNNEHPPMGLRVNQRIITRDEYYKKLLSLGVAATIYPFNQTGLVLAHPCRVEDLPGFANGEVSVQDCGAQFAAPWLDLQPQQRVLDACAAPGGKTAHILEQQPQLAEMVAFDIDPERLKKVKDNLKRLNLSATVFCADVTKPDKWWNEVLYDRILLDAPCSASGVIRRNADIKILRLPQDINQFATQQLQMLQGLWSLLQPNGKLLYVTCSIFKQENDQVIEKFLSITKNAAIAKQVIAATHHGVSLQIDGSIATKFGRQLLPSEMHDGFYYTLLEKI